MLENVRLLLLFPSPVPIHTSLNYNNFIFGAAELSHYIGPDPLNYASHHYISLSSKKVYVDVIKRFVCFCPVMMVLGPLLISEYNT